MKFNPANAFIVLVLLAGCAAGAPAAWLKTGASEADLKRDTYACTQESRVGTVAPTEEKRIFFHGDNKLAQDEANRLYRACMESRGWSVVEHR